MIGDAFALDESDDIGFVHRVRPIAAGAVRAAEPREIYVVKIDSWFGDKWLGFSNKLAGAVGVQHREALRVPPFVPARVRAQAFLRRSSSGAYALVDARQPLHVEQASEDNARRLMSIVCPDAAAVWWSGDTRRHGRGCVMAYLPTEDGHAGWYAELQRRSDVWTVSRTVCTTTQELAAYENKNAAS